MAGRNLQNMLVPAAIVIGGISFILLGLYIPERQAPTPAGDGDGASALDDGAGAAPALEPDRPVAPASDLTLAIRAGNLGAVQAALDGGAGYRLTGDQGWFVTFGAAISVGLPWRP